MAAGYLGLLRQAQGRRTYTYVLINALLHSGIYTWLGVYLHQRFELGEFGIGLTLLGYGVPGLLLGPVIGRLADRYGRARIIPAGVALGGICALLLASPLPLLAVQASIVALSLGYDMTQPPLGGIVTNLPGHGGLAMARACCWPRKPPAAMRPTCAPAANAPASPPAKPSTTGTSPPPPSRGPPRTP